MILRGLSEAAIELQDDDVLVLASKIVSKAEGRVVSLQSVEPSTRAQELARGVGKDAREVELMLRESSDVVRVRKDLIITRHRLGFVSANAGLDHSNVGGDVEAVILLPENPDASAGKIRTQVQDETGKQVGVVIADSHGRPHRLGTVGVAIGVAGLPALEDWRGRQDLFGYILQHTEIGLADMIASAATLLLGQAREGTPVVHVRGVIHSSGAGTARDLIRPMEMDLFQ
jgi:coenzyme F420-0:L-glutamate ligase/coenzyme F420-1:gamma-L-glutamate ligase